MTLMGRKKMHITLCPLAPPTHIDPQGHASKSNPLPDADEKETEKSVARTWVFIKSGSSSWRRVARDETVQSTWHEGLGTDQC